MKISRFRTIPVLFLIFTLIHLCPVTARAANTEDNVFGWVLDQGGHWYHYDYNGNMNVGWFQDADSSWYYLNSADDQTRGIMQTGWHNDLQDGNWYYLEPQTGRMVTGQVVIDGFIYYFNDSGSEQSGWHWDSASNTWIYNEREQRPLGMLEGGYISPGSLQ